MNDIFTPWEGYSQYSEEQINLLRGINYNNNKITKIEKTIAKDVEEIISIEKSKKDPEEEGEYILWLA